MEKYLKIGMAILFFICLANMPYGYYQLVRMVALVGFVILALKSYERDDKVMLIVYIGLALLFQPIFKVPLGRNIWNLVDAAVGIGLLISVYNKPEREPNDQQPNT